MVTLCLVSPGGWRGAKCKRSRRHTIWPSPYGEGRLLSVHAALRRDTGDPHGTVTLLAAALDIFQRLGARKDIEWTQSALQGEYTGDSNV